jgi:YfiH family protein
VSLSLSSPLLRAAQFAHGFSLREASPAQLAADVGYGADALFEVSQVHGARVRVVEGSEDRVAVRAEEADALVTRVAGVAIGVRVADCLPLLLADVRTGAVAAVHCGWRGVAAEIVDRALDLLFAGGTRADDLRAVIGPHIRACCFEVGDEVVASLRLVSCGVEPVAQPIAGRKPHVELAAIVGAQLEARGVMAAQRDDTGGCTRCDAERFYSYRRDGARAGRHHAVIVAR